MGHALGKAIHGLVSLVGDSWRYSACPIPPPMYSFHGLVSLVGDSDVVVIIEPYSRV